MSPLPKMDTPMSTTAAAPVADTAPRPDEETVTSVRHYTDKLFAFRVTRPASLRFRAGEFVMIGLMSEDEKPKPVLRAYSIASPVWDEELEFYSIKVPDGPLTSRLQRIEPGDRVIVKTKPVGTLVTDALLPGRRLWLVCTGTGIAPFASLLRDPDVYELFDEVILAHTCRTRDELTYGRELVAGLPDDPLVGEHAGRVRYYPTTTREPSQYEGRVSDLIDSGKLASDLGIDPLGADDRVMICGSLPLNTQMKDICERRGLEEGANSKPGGYVVEKAFVGEGVL